jgi:hypothetical protein
MRQGTEMMGYCTPIIPGETNMNAATDVRTIKLPNGQEATFEEMQCYGEILQEFIRGQEARLVHVTDTNRHNQIIDYLQTLADAYNEQLGIFRSVEAQRQGKQLVALIHFVEGHPERFT